MEILLHKLELDRHTFKNEYQTDTSKRKWVSSD